MQNVVFFDIDGTLWNREFIVPKSTKTAIKKLKENGNRAYICSGRARSYIRNRQLKELGFDGVVAGCGTYVEMDGKVVQNILMPKELLNKTVELMKKNELPLVLEGWKHIFLDEEDFFDTSFPVIIRNEMGEDMMPLTGTEHLWEINKLSVDISPSGVDHLIDILEEDYEILRHENVFMELVPKGYSKATGIEFVCEMLGVDKAHTYAFGDATNDIEMLKAAGVGICMGNGLEGSKKAADFVTDSVDDDGVFNALEHFGLI